METTSQIDKLNINLPKFANENSSFTQNRLDALKHFSLLAMPNNYEHNWKYSNIDKLSLDTSVNIVNSHKANNFDFISQYLKPFISSFIFLNTTTTQQTGHAVPNLYLSTLNNALINKQGLIDKLNQSFNTDNELIDKIYFYSQAYCNSGAVIDLKDNTKIEPTIIIYNEINTPINQLNFLNLNDNSEAKVILINFNQNLDTNNSLTNCLNKIKVGKNAKLYLAELNILNDQTFYIGKSFVELDRDARLEYLNFSLGSIQTKSDILTNLNNGSQISLYGSAFGRQNNNLSFNTIVNHLNPHAQSNIDYHIVLNDNAKSFYQGSIFVDEHANGTQAYQSNKNLLLGSGTHAESLPKLEILANEVHCSHGATVGKLDLDQLFYLQTRGLSRLQAEKLLIEGFLKQTFKRYAQTELFDLLSLFINEQLEVK